MEEKKQKCLDWLSDVKSGKEVSTPFTRKPGNEDLPPGIYRHKSHDKCGFEVNIKGIIRKRFNDFQQAADYRTSCLEVKGVLDDIITEIEDCKS